MNLEFLREALRLSIEKMESSEGGPFGAVWVRNREIAGRGRDQFTSTNDPTAQAEVVAIRETCSGLWQSLLAECEIYSGRERYPLCLAAIYWTRLDGTY